MDSRRQQSLPGMNHPSPQHRFHLRSPRSLSPRPTRTKPKVCLILVAPSTRPTDSKRQARRARSSSPTRIPHRPSHPTIIRPRHPHRMFISTRGCPPPVGWVLKPPSMDRVTSTLWTILRTYLRTWFERADLLHEGHEWSWLV